ncbi:MAG: hypothetical protein R3D57_07225 [Hyphomicrobiaceae bacterium]
MLISRSCPHTGILNYYRKSEPFLSVGSVQRRAGDGVAWRCHIADHPAAGAAASLKAAEKQLKQHIEVAARPSVADRAAA